MALAGAVPFEDRHRFVEVTALSNDRLRPFPQEAIGRAAERHNHVMVDRPRRSAVCDGALAGSWKNIEFRMEDKRIQDCNFSN